MRWVHLLALTGTAVVMTSAALGGCSDDNAEVITTGPGSGGSGAEGGTGTGGTGGMPDCYTNPMTHIEIINACTTPDVVKIDKQPNLPQLNPDGSLPPLP